MEIAGREFGNAARPLAAGSAFVGGTGKQPEGVLLDSRGEGLGRWGGEEFVLLLPGTNERGASLLLERIHAALAAHGWSQVSPGLAVSTSAGISQWQLGDSLDALLQRADRALYRAKAKGRSCTVVACETPAARAGVSH